MKARFNQLTLSFLLFCIAIPSIISSQCDNVTITNQTEMDNFNCSTVKYLQIQNNDPIDPIIDFQNLDLLDSITDVLSVFNFDNQPSTISFENLKFAEIISVSSITTVSFPELTEVDNLSCGGDIDSISLPKLKTITGLLNLNIADSSDAYIYELDSLQSLYDLRINPRGLSTISFLAKVSSSKMEMASAIEFQ